MPCLLKCCRVRHVMARRGAAAGSTWTGDVPWPPSPSSGNSAHRSGFFTPAVAAKGLRNAPQAGCRSRRCHSGGAPFRTASASRLQGAAAVYVWLRQITSPWNWKFTSVTTLNREGVHARSEKMNVQRKGDNENNDAAGCSCSCSNLCCFVSIRLEYVGDVCLLNESTALRSL